MDWLNIGRSLNVYDESGQYDENEMKNEPLDGVWCSIYDVLKLAKLGIIEPFDDEDEKAAIAYLNDAKAYTKKFKNFVVDL